MENSESETVLSRIENLNTITTSTKQITVVFGNEKITFVEYPGANDANVELRSQKTMLKLRNAILDARNAQGKAGAEEKNVALENTLIEVNEKFEILDFQ